MFTIQSAVAEAERDRRRERIAEVKKDWKCHSDASGSRLRGGRIIFGRNVLAGVVRHQTRRYQAHHCAGGDVDRDGIACVIRAKSAVAMSGAGPPAITEAS